MKNVVLNLLFLFCFINGHAVCAQTITTIAGGATGHGGYWGEGGPATAAELDIFGGLAVDKFDNVYIAQGSRIVRVDAATGIIHTIAGTGVNGYNGDDIPATAAQINNAGWLKLDSAGNIYIGDNNPRIRKIDATTGIISTFAGNGTLGFSGDGGPATAADFDFGVFTFDVFGNMLIASISDHRIRKIEPSGIISTIAGTGGPGNSGNGGAATAATLSPNFGICSDIYGNIYFGDSSYSIRKIDVNTGIITNVAGSGSGIGSPYSGDGIPATATVLDPFIQTFDNSGNLYNADKANSRIEKVNTSGIIYTIVGNGTHGYSGDNGPATAAEISYPENVVLDGCGNIYIADFNNARVRKVTNPPVLAVPTISLSGTPSAIAGSMVTVNATVTNAGSSYLIHWLNHGMEFTTTAVPSVTYTKQAGTDTITARVVPTGYGCWDSTTSAAHIITVSTEGVPFGGLTVTGVEVYPNPVSDVLHIGVEISSSYKLFSIVGTVIQSGNLQKGNNSIPVKSLHAGMYMLEVAGSDGERTIAKIIKQ